MMARLLALGLLLLSLPATAETEGCRVHFETLPPGCRVLVEEGPHSATGENGVVSVPRELIPAQGKLKFRLLRAGYHDLEAQIPVEHLQGEVRWPVQVKRFLRFQPQLVTAVFHTRPSGAEIWVLRGGGRREFLGLTGEPIPLNLGNLAGNTEAGYFEVRLELEGHRGEKVPIPNHLFGTANQNRWPQHGSYALQADNFIAVFRDHQEVGLSFGALAFLFVAAWLGPRARSRRRLLERARQIENSEVLSFDNLKNRRLDRYRLLKPLGAGGMGVVYRAVLDADLGSEVRAIKLVRPTQEMREQFRAEVISLLAVRHPNVVRLDDWGEFNGLLYIVMELVEGKSLRSEIEACPGPRPELLGPLMCVMAGVCAAHRRGLIHCDLKPENILVSVVGEVKVVDFGLARPLAAPAGHQTRGTLGYVAPELFSGQPPGPASDQYALGVIAYELLTRRLPFLPDPGSYLSSRQLTEEAPMADELNPHLPAELVAVVARMLRCRPEERYPSVAEAANCLRAAVEDGPVAQLSGSEAEFAKHVT